MAFTNPSNNTQNDKGIKRSQPITIDSSNLRRRSASVSSASSGSASSPSEIITPISGTANPQLTAIPSPSTSPILSYFLAQSPTKTPTAATFPFKRNFGPTPLFEDEQEIEAPVTSHTRRASSAVAGRFSTQQQNPPLQDENHERGVNLLRRLSLSSGFVRPNMGNLTGRTQSPPSPPPNSAASPTAGQSFPSPGRKPRRAATLNTDGVRPRRAPSPMGERILKGHFDGFN